ncbi:hypothetical protein [Ewingella americana]|nr:hypothetical protein [Ewingella americana]
MASSLLVGVNGKGSDSATTKSAVSDGNIVTHIIQLTAQIDGIYI